MKRRVIKIFAIICAVIAVCPIILSVAFVASVKHSDDYVNFDQDKLNKVYTNVTILDANGKQIGEPLCVGNVRQVPLSALHDYTYLAFVAVEDKRFFSHNGLDGRRIIGALAHNVKSRSYKEGASTISQQLIKNTHLTSGKTLKRKVNEMLLAKELEKNYSKWEILEMYLNTIYFGRSAYGIENASNVYFNKSATQLTVAESATLAGMIKAPNIYAPNKNEQKCKQRRDTVLKLMLEQDVITQDEYCDAVSRQVDYRPQTANNETSYTQMCIKEACKLLNMTESQLLQQNLIIETYCDKRLQSEVTELVKSDKTQTQNNTLADLNCIVCTPTGDVKAFYSRGKVTKRQAGSTLKPIAVYTPAFDQKLITQASPILDDDTNFSGYDPSGNYKHVGWTTVKYAVVHSLNVPAVKTLNSLGLDKSQKYLTKLGIVAQDLSVALGNAKGGLDVTELANCYATLSNNGNTNGTAFIKNIYNKDGCLLYSRQAENMQVFGESSAFLMTDILTETSKSGTAKRLDKNYQIAAKTGTVGDNNGNSDALVAGYTTDNVFVVWYSGNLPNTVNGSTNPCEFASKLLDKIYTNNTPNNFDVPDNVVSLSVDENQLKTNQILQLSHNGKQYYFTNDNRPFGTVTSTAKQYKLQVNCFDGKLQITLPPTSFDETWELYKISNNAETQLQADNGILENVTDGTYFAKMFVDAIFVAETPQLTVSGNKQ